MEPESKIPHVIRAHALDAGDFNIARVGSGYIHDTYKLTGVKSYILQRVNKNVFKEPEVIAANIRNAARYLHKHQPDYLFPTPIVSTNGADLVYDDDGYPWRLFPYIDNTFTVDKVTTTAEAFSAAQAFGQLTRYLHGADMTQFRPTIDRFHDLSWRWEQFETALDQALSERRRAAGTAIAQSQSHRHIVDQYKALIHTGRLEPRITHNDTKINNILFHSATARAVCAIDLDTLMPGYFIYDFGDMVRTFVSPVDEEERDLEKVIVRTDILNSLTDGYLSQMGAVLTESEKAAIPFSGMMMTYIMALRMLTDYLNGDIYYQTRYPGQNLVRALNQLKLLSELQKLQ